MDFPVEESTTQKIPILLEKTIERVIARTQPNDLLQKDVFFILIITLMVENGFTPISDEFKCMDIKSYLDIFSGQEAKFVLMGFQDISVKLIMSPLGAMVLLNIVISELNLDTYSICLPVSRYVVSLHASTIPLMFRDLRHLAFTFKNKMVVPVKSRILSHSGYPSASLIGLPEEVFHRILLYLPVSDVINVSKTCNRLQMLIANESLWHDLFRRDFQELQTDRSDWRNLYRETFITRSDDNLRHIRQNYINNYTNFPFNIDNFIWDVI
ncbi:uncharacterized protein LOC113517527 [Galleria mellonella]|uniref:Uncharacterized protein LOC113517527 n=1 Tax=Galleria mellonella TaxID=7137 RepID=A0A6J1WYA1_GALME|nr:uncharacterized protein LOC113517527 [Galleria mellonella]